MIALRQWTRHPAAFWAGLAVSIAAAATLGLLRLAPERAALAAAMERAEELIGRTARVAETCVGPRFDKGVEDMAAGRKARAQKFEGDRARSSAKLSSWFGDLKIPEAGGAPARDEFQRGYSFHRDRLDEAIRDLLRKSGGPDSARTATMNPAFLSGAPPKAEELLRWQRLANVEKLMLEAAAREGAASVKPTEIEREPLPLGDPDRAYVRYRVRAFLAVPTRRTARALAALVHAGDDIGATGKLLGFSVEPGGPELPRKAGDEPPMLLSVSLAFGFPLAAPEEGGP